MLCVVTFIIVLLSSPRVRKYHIRKEGLSYMSFIRGRQVLGQGWHGGEQRFSPLKMCLTHCIAQGTILSIIDRQIDRQIDREIERQRDRYRYIKLNHLAVHQKVTQHCKLTILQLGKKFFLKLGDLLTVMKPAESKPKSESRPKPNFLQPELSLS